MEYKKHNEEIQKRYGNIPLAISSVNDRKINSICFTPFEDMEIKRSFEIGNAFQIKETEAGLDIYYEPVVLYSKNRMVFIKDIPEKGILKGDKCEISNINSRNKLEVVVDKVNGVEYVKGISPLDCVYDSDYKFAHFVKVSTANRIYISGNDNMGYEKGSHFTNDNNPIVHTIRYKGALNKQVAIEMREQFEKDYPGLVKLEKEGTYAVLLTYKYPGHNGKYEPKEMDIYFRPIKFSVLETQLKPINKFKMK